MGFEGQKMSDTKLSDAVKRALTFIEKEGVSYKELMNLYRNIDNSEDITDSEKEILTEKVISVMRTSFPRESGKLLGNKSNKPIEVLEEINYETQAIFDMSDNSHGSGVKAGGDMMSGRKHIAHYISYCNPSRWSASIAYHQDKPDTEPFFKLRHWQNRSKESEDIRYFRVEDKLDAVSDYHSCLEQVGCPKK
jgi:hypothetical protein